MHWQDDRVMLLLGLVCNHTQGNTETPHTLVGMGSAALAILP